MTEEQVQELIELNKKLLADNEALRAKIQTQEDLIAALLKKLYGVKSEKIDTNQLLMTFLEDEGKKSVAAGPEEEPAAKPKPTKTKRKRLKRGLVDGG